MRRFLTVPTAILTVVFLIAGCTSSDDTADETTTAAPVTTVAPPETVTTVATTVTVSTAEELDAEAVARAVTEGIEVRFTEEECSHSGPSVLPEGEYVIIFRGVDGKAAADFYVQSIDDGKTYQDIIELQGGVPGEYYPRPGFITYATTVDSDFDTSTGNRRVTYAFEESEYYIDAFAGVPMGAWLCGAFTVIAE